MKRRSKRLGAWFLLLAVSLTVICGNAMVTRAVTPGSTDYHVFLNGSKFFLHNEKTLGSENGTEYYLTYTVKSAAKSPTQHGIIGTGDITRRFPYNDGGLLRYAGKSILLDEGATYFIKFVVAEGGFRYKITRAQGDTLEDLYVEKYYGKATDEMKYFGIWLDVGTTQAELTNVRCYDANGNDLGVKLENPDGMGYVLRGDTRFEKATDIDHRYDIKVTDKRNIAISNLKVPTTSDVYIEYKVESAEYLLNQAGIAFSNDPTSDYPHRNGYLKYLRTDDVAKSMELLEVGAEYIIKIQRGETGADVIVQKTKNGQRSITVLSVVFGTYDKTFDFLSLWYGAGGNTNATFHLTDFKIYDENRNNLGVQCNVDAEITHTGEVLDYAGCEAAYYCKENGSIMALYKDQTMKLTEDSVTLDAEYKVAENVMTARYASGTKEYAYLYRRITDESHVYDRLYHYLVNFVTGSDTKIETQHLSNATGYLALRPTDPELKGCTFEGWCTSEGKEFDFDQIVTESVTLYAKWSDNGGITYPAGDEPVTPEDTSFVNRYLLYGAGGLLLIAGLAVCIVLIGKGMRSESIKKK